MCTSVRFVTVVRKTLFFRSRKQRSICKVSGNLASMRITSVIDDTIVGRRLFIKNSDKAITHDKIFTSQSRFSLGMHVVVCLIYKPDKSGLASESARYILQYILYWRVIMFLKLILYFTLKRNSNFLKLFFFFFLNQND